MIFVIIHGIYTILAWPCCLGQPRHINDVDSVNILSLSLVPRLAPTTTCAHLPGQPSSSHCCQLNDARQLILGGIIILVVKNHKGGASAPSAPVWLRLCIYIYILD